MTLFAVNCRYVTLELNEVVNRIQGKAPHQLTDHAGTAGVPQEYSPFIVERRVTLTDARLVSVVGRWMKLPDSVRYQIKALSDPLETVLPW